MLFKIAQLPSLPNSLSGEHLSVIMNYLKELPAVEAVESKTDGERDSPHSALRFCPIVFQDY